MFANLSNKIKQHPNSFQANDFDANMIFGRSFDIDDSLMQSEQFFDFLNSFEDLLAGESLQDQMNLGCIE